MTGPKAGTVLVIDDDVHLRSTIVELLRGEGHSVAQASNGYTGLRLVAEVRPHVVLLDLALPEMSGLEVLTELRKDPHTQDTVVIVLTAHMEMEVPERLGAAAIMSKPFGVPELLDAVHRAIVAAEHRRTEVPPALGPAPHDRVAPRRTPRPPKRTNRR